MFNVSNKKASDLYLTELFKVKKLALKVSVGVPALKGVVLLGCCFAEDDSKMTSMRSHCSIH